MKQSLPLAGRYRFLKRLSAGPPRTVWLAEEVSSCSLVIVVRVANRFARMLAPVVRVQHPHLACLLEILDAPPPQELPEEERDGKPSPFAVAEWVSGQTLYDALMQSAIDRHRAVQTITSVASAVSAIHSQEAFHGAISARSVVLDRMDGTLGPVLTQVIMPADGSYACPERLSGKGPGQPDDVWALHALLYAALTGQRPFRARTREDLLKAVENPSPVPLDAFGVTDAELQEIIDRGFHPNASERTTSVQAMEAALFSWLAHNCTDEDVTQEALVQSNGILNQAGPKDERNKLEDDSTERTEGPIQSVLASMNANGSTPGSEPNAEATDEPILPPSVFAKAAVVPPSEVPDAPVSQRESPVPSASVLPGDEPDAPAVRNEQVCASRPPEAAERARSTTLRRAAFALVGLLTVGGAVAGGYYQARVRGIDPIRSASKAFRSAGVWTPSATESSPPASASSQSPATDTSPLPTAAETKQPAAGSVAPTDSGDAPPRSDVSACVAAQFSPETFAKPQDLAFVCEVADARSGATKLRAKIIMGSGGTMSEGMQMWPRLLWHELAVYGMLRRRCCAAAAIELPAPKPECVPLGDAVNALSDAYAQERDITRPLEKFVEAARCAHRLLDRSYRYTTGPMSGGQVAFELFVKRNIAP